MESILLICLVSSLVLRTMGNLDHLDVEVEYQCIQHCPLQNRTDVGHYDYACDYDCNIDQCAKGCKLWRKALGSSCQKTCVNNGVTERLTPKELYCVMGCNDAMTKYFSQLRARLLTPPSPALVADSLNSTSLKLEWKFPEAKKDGLSCHIQWRYEELTAAWQFSRNVTWEQGDSIAVIKNLQPYTKYRFRVALIFAHHGEPIVSIPSVVISTLPSGVPASPPTIVRAAPIDCTRISISWEPGPFPHGPLLSYVLQITDNHPEIHSEVKDIAPENNFYMFRNLRPARHYTISIRMRNGIGFGPSASVSVSTPPEPLIKDVQQPILILGTERTVIEQGTNILDEPTVIYSSDLSITGIAVHLRKRILFLSNSAGYVLKMILSEKRTENVTNILLPSQITFIPHDLSVDWLNDQLYILGEVNVQKQKMWQIARCSLDGKGLTVAIAGLRVRPHNIEIDPYNGYLFWIIQQYDMGGLYRLDISDISNGIKHEVQPELILQHENFGAFTVDHTNFRLLVSNQKQNTINSVSFDGKEITNLRPNVIKSKLQKVVSLAIANKKFYWTDGDDVFYEEHHKSDDSYFHNSYPDLTARSYKKIIINLESSQPVPIPVNPPTNVQAIFGCNLTKISWKVPHLLGIQGKGAWQNWSYEIALKEVKSEKLMIQRNINTTSCTIKNLKENTDYIIKVAAYTSFGKSPWSTEFHGITLKQSEKPIILWSAAEGLLNSDATGENVHTLIHKSHMRNFHFTDIAWYKNQIYLVTNNSQVHWYNLNNHQQGRLIDIVSVGSIAIDWVGKKLYWSNPKQQLIIRGSFNGTQQEPLPILTLAKELNIDSVKAYLYWSTGYAVECAHLNGADRMEYHHAQLFSGRQVMGLTLDMDQKYVYWIVRDSESSKLFKAPMAGYNENNVRGNEISSLKKPNMQGSLCYFHKRLLWLQDDKNAVISDLNEKNIATISGKSMSGLTMVYVIDSGLHQFPSTKEVVVIPEVIDRNSVKVIGSANSFNITFKPITNVNYGNVFYEVKIDSLSGNESTVITTFPSVKYWQQVTPFTKLHIALRAFTYWGASPQIIVKINSPPSTPSVPRNLRSYVTYQHNNSNLISITFRWDPPMFPNGVIQGYKVFCWYINNQTHIDLCNNSVKPSDDLEFVLNLKESEIYYFQVQAFTEIGDGKISNTISVNSSHEIPLPTLLIASSDSIFIQDIDSNKNFSVVQGINPPNEIAYLIKEQKVFWINSLQELFVFNSLNNNKTKIIDLNPGAKSLTIDWLERSLYYLECDDYNTGSSVYKIDLNHIDKNILNIVEIFSTESTINKIEVSPFTKKLYWVENSKLMESNTDGTNIKSFFSEHSHNKRDVNEKGSCTCPSNIDVQETFAVDHSNIKMKPLLIFIDAITQNVMSADKDGCFCNVIANNTVTSKSFPLEQINSDFGTLYWTNPSQGILYALKKKESNLLTKSVNVHDILIFGSHMQPYPERECLTPMQHNSVTVLLKEKTSNSLTVQMPNYIVNSNCSNVSLATVEYQIYYAQYKDGLEICNNSNCNLYVSFDKIVTITGLKPFTKYIISVAVNNYYMKSQELLIGPSVIFQTASGAPSKPQKVSAVVLNPNLVKVSWIPPAELNGATVHYEIYWKTEGAVSGVRQKEQPIVEQQTSSEYITTLLNKLSPNETYTIWVRAYSEANETSSDSDKVQITTYPEPNSFVLTIHTAYSLKLIWNISSNVDRYVVQFSPITSNEWTNVEVIEDMNMAKIFIDNLKPKTQHKFRLSLYYKNYHKPYIWPSDSRFTFETLGDRPTPPGIPIIQYIKANVYKIWWEASKDNGAPIDLYMLEGLRLPYYRTKRSTNRTAYFYTAPSIEEEERKWESFYNGTNTSWIVNGLRDEYKYVFRVSALNSYGWSDPSQETDFNLSEAARMAEKQIPVTSIIIGLSVSVSVCIVIIFVVFCCWKCSKPKKIPNVIVPRGPDVELATLRELPRRGIHSTNILYGSVQHTADEIHLLPNIVRENITLNKFLGRGAFGEVFEGTVVGISNNNTVTKVAIKTLRKGASDQEKLEFLQEAHLMSNFKHEHILQLIGVCLDNDPHYIIMELMQGGDLLTYLRSSRNPPESITSLTLIELLKMCVDVAKGCQYLEELHFVHRDLACRNCLVSSMERDNRIVKIGDFGLARDIYKNDYYRKEGEGLLPVRWMSPESLVDGVFTTHSDVWAFGILLWEIMTLGQQPYQARNNMEVLNYVKLGGRLGKPMSCPETLHLLMLQCWEFKPEKRPTFKSCLDILNNLHLQNIRNPITAAHEGPYISTVIEQFDGISNEAYFLDENYNSLENSCKSENDDELNKEQTPFLTENPQEEPTIPKYLELVYEPDCHVPNDGYLVPNQVLPLSNECKPSSSVSLKNGGLSKIKDSV